jgi:hypothetical protein
MSLENKITKVDVDDLNILLEQEKQRNKGEVWIKLNKTARIQKLYDYADNYGKEKNMIAKDIRLLKNFFKSCLDRNKLNRAKDVVYNKETREVVSIPALQFNPITRNFTLRIMDTKRVSTLKSLTPKKSDKPSDEKEKA